jgi:hypothetical protein
MRTESRTINPFLTGFAVAAGHFNAPLGTPGGLQQMTLFDSADQMAEDPERDGPDAQSD